MYGFNGQERSDEIKGSGNSYTAEFWEYDPRIGIRWNIDPKTKDGVSPYACLMGNPIFRKDVNGDEADSVPKILNNISKALSRVYVTAGVNGVATSPAKNSNEGSTLIGSLYGGAQPYGSTFKGGPDEPNSYVQILYSLLHDDSRQIGIHWMKNKIQPFANGLKDEAPTTLDVIYGGKIKERNLSKSFAVSGSLYVGAGLLLAAPIMTNGGRLVNAPPIIANLGDPYRVAGLSEVMIARVDVTFVHRISVFVAGTVHNMQTFAQQTTTGDEPVKALGLASVASGIKVRL